MNEDEIRKLEAGPITNMHVARLVFNHDAVGYTEYPDGTRLYYGGPDNSYPLLDYSTDIAAAWRVVEKLLEKYWIEIHSTSDKEWAVLLYRRGTGTIVVHCTAPTAPLAICRAALLAVSELEEK